MTSAFVVVPRQGSVGAARGELTLAQRPRRQLPDDAAVDPLREHLLDPDVTDVFVNGERGVFVDRGRGAEPVEGWCPDEAEVRALAVALIAIGGRHLDDAKTTFRHISHLGFSVFALCGDGCGQRARR